MARKKKPSRKHTVPGGSRRKPPKSVKMINLAEIRRRAEEADRSAGQSGPRHDGE